MRKSWLDRNPGWKIPLGCLTLVLLMSVSGMTIATIIVTTFHHSDVYQQAMAMAEKNPQVRERIGEPIQSAWLISGNLNVNGSTGNANISIPISRPTRQGSDSCRCLQERSLEVFMVAGQHRGPARHRFAFCATTGVKRFLKIMFFLRVPSCP